MALASGHQGHGQFPIDAYISEALNKIQGQLALLLPLLLSNRFDKMLLVSGVLLVYV